MFVQYDIDMLSDVSLTLVATLLFICAYSPEFYYRGKKPHKEVYKIRSKKLKHLRPKYKFSRNVTASHCLSPFSLFPWPHDR